MQVRFSGVGGGNALGVHKLAAAVSSVQIEGSESVVLCFQPAVIGLGHGNLAVVQQPVGCRLCCMDMVADRSLRQTQLPGNFRLAFYSSFLPAT